MSRCLLSSHIKKFDAAKTEKQNTLAAHKGTHIHVLSPVDASLSRRLQSITHSALLSAHSARSPSLSFSHSPSLSLPLFLASEQTNALCEHTHTQREKQAFECTTSLFAFVTISLSSFIRCTCTYGDGNIIMRNATIVILYFTNTCGENGKMCV